MFRQIKYFQAIVRCKNFTQAAEESYISQSAISQQIQALEKKLGVKLLKREKRSFSLTSAGEFFYKKSLMLTNDLEQICAQTTRIGNGIKYDFSIGYPKYYRGRELPQAIAGFQKKYPNITMQTINGTHEELYKDLRTNKADIIINDLRRALSTKYFNYYLTRVAFFAEFTTQNQLSKLTSINIEDLKNIPCIIIADNEDAQEENFYREYLGVKSDFLLADSIEQAHMMVVSGKGFFPVESILEPAIDNSVICHIPILLRGKPIYHEYYAFWRRPSAKEYIEKFATYLKEFFSVIDK